MAKRNQLGIFLGNDGLHFIETSGVDPKNIFVVPFKEQTRLNAKKSSYIWGTKEIIIDIAKALSDRNITTSNINLSLPTKDIIFRSFVIPWMQSHEIKSVVEFEAGKYIPFALDELSYSFHPITITENNTKLIRIIFVAIKNDALDEYIKILRSASLTIGIIEPAASSLIRALSFKKLIPKDQTIALIEMEEMGRIIIVDNGVPQFVREFYLSTVNMASDPESPDDPVKKLTKEVHISLEYFNRQNEYLEVKKIFLITSSGNEEVVQDLERYLNIPVAAIDEQSILDGASEGGIDILNAYGASITQAIDAPTSFDFAKKKTGLLQPQKIFDRKPINYKSLLKTSLICVPLIFASIFFSTFSTNSLKNQISTLKETLGSFQDADVSFIKQNEKNLQTKLDNFKNTRIQSDTALFLLLIPELLPENTWINNLDIEYEDPIVSTQKSATRNKQKSTASKALEIQSSVTITIEGYAYSEDKNKQFRLVNELLRKLKRDNHFSELFGNIDLETTKIQKLNEHDVTFFRIVCQQNNENTRLTKN